MIGAATITQRIFELHGVAIGVCAQEPAPIDAMEVRLRDFGSQTASHPDLQLEFVDDLTDPAPPPETGRPVYDTPHGTLHYAPEADVLYGRVGRVQLRCEAGRGRALFHSPAYAGRDLYLATHPLATISLMEMLERRGLFALHAACLASGGGHGVLLAGASGAGKSTLALALAHTGMGFLSDDIVFLAPDPKLDKIRVLGFADTVGLTDYAATRFPALQAFRDDSPAPGFPKRLHRIEHLFGVPALPDCEPCALVFPEVTREGPSQIAPLDPGAAMLRLVPDVLLTDPGATQAHLRAIAAVLKQVRCYTLLSGTDLERAAELVQALV